MRSDPELAIALQAGDRDALAEIYDRYADRLHDFCHSMLRDREEAADAMQDTFLVVAQRVGQLRDPERLKSWLYAIARNEALRRLRSRKRLSYDDDLTALPAGGRSLDDEASVAELRELVWSAAGGLNPRDQALLDLHVRQGLEGKDLALAVGVEPAHVYVMLTRLRDQVERSLGALLVARTGRRDCPELARLLDGWDGTFSPLMRKRVGRHVDSCDRCESRRRATASPLALLSGVALVPVPLGLRARVLDHAQNAAYEGPAVELDDTGFPKLAAARRAWVRPVGAASASVAAAAVATVLLLATGAIHSTLVATAPGRSSSAVSAETAGGPGTGVGTASASSHATPTTARSPSTSPEPDSVGVLSLSAGVLDFGTMESTQPLVLANMGASPLEWTITAASPVIFAPSSGSLQSGETTTVVATLDRTTTPEGTLSMPITISSTTGNATVEIRALIDRAPVVTSLRSDTRDIYVTSDTCAPTTTPAHVEVRDGTGVVSVTLHWRLTHVSGGAPHTVASGADNISKRVDSAEYLGILGEFTVTGTLSYWVTATDTAGHSTESDREAITVNPCLIS